MYPKYWDRQDSGNSVDQDQTPQKAASDLGLHCLPIMQQFSDTSTGSETGLQQVSGRYDVPVFRVNAVVSTALYLPRFSGV